MCNEVIKGTEEDPVIGWGPGVKEVIVSGWGQGVNARGVVRGVIDKEVRNLAGNACAWVGVLGFDHTHAPAVILPFEEDAPVDQVEPWGIRKCTRLA